jgi:competence protein ComEC
MERWILSLITGSLFSLFLPIVPTHFCIVLFILTISCYCFFIKHPCKAFFFLGAGLMLYQGTSYENVWHVNELNKENIAYQALTVQGTIAQVPYKSKNIKLLFRIDTINGKPLNSTILARLSWQDANHRIAHDQRWSLLVKLKPATGLANPFGFSYQTWLRANGIHATGYIKNIDDNVLLHKSCSWRQSFYDRFIKLIPQSQVASVVLALSLGNRGGINQEQWDVFRQTGTQHLIAISGLHIGLVMMFSTLVFSKMPRFIFLHNRKKSQTNTLVNRLNLNVLALLFGVVCAACYAYLAGFSIPTQRALIMISCLFCFRFVSLYLTSLQSVLIAAFLVILIMPLSILSISFWLSFYAVVVIIFYLWKFDSSKALEKACFIKRLASGTIKLAKLQLCLTLLMFPISILLNQTLYFSGILANMIAIPIISLLVMPVILLSMLASIIFPRLTELLLSFAQWILELLWHYLSTLATHTELQFSISASYFFWCLILGIVLWVLFKFVNNAKGYLTLILLVSGSNYAHHFRGDTEWRTQILDVGQGLAIVVEHQGKTLLYDTGPRFKSGFNTGEAVVIPYLQGTNQPSIDLLVLSHLDNDHAGSIEPITNKLSVRNFLGNGRYFSSVNACTSGKSVSFGHLSIDVLWPDSSILAVVGKKNDESCVLKISDSQHSVLLTGDISAKIEQKLVQKYQGTVMLKSDVLIAPHHGSKTSSTKLFIDSVNPEFVVFSTGKYNRWKMPNEQVTERYKQKKITTFNTAESGMITLEFFSAGININQYRQNTWPFWFAN